MNDRRTPRKPPIKLRLPKQRIAISDIVPETKLPEIDLLVPWYHKASFQKGAGLTAAIAGAVLYFIPGTQALGGILASVGTTAWGTAAQFQRIKRKRAAGDRTWLDILLEIVRKLLEAFRKSK